jgi:hypothetical protein
MMCTVQKAIILIFYSYRFESRSKDIKEILNVYYISILDNNCQPFNWSNHRRKRSLTDEPSGGLNVELEASSTVTDGVSMEDGLQMKCLVFVDNEWTPEPCVTKSITTSTDGETATVKCDCSIDGYMAVGLVASDDTIMYLEEIFTFEERINFKIDVDYDMYVGPNVTEFKSAMRTQLAFILNCDLLNIRELQVYPGSIIIDFLLVASSDLEADELRQSYTDMMNLLESGQLKLVKNILKYP